MNKKVIKVALILLAMVGNCLAGCCSAPPDLQCRKEVKPDPVEKVLKQLREKTAELKSYQCLVEYEVNQPTFESKTLRNSSSLTSSSSGTTGSSLGVCLPVDAGVIPKVVWISVSLCFDIS